MSDLADDVGDRTDPSERSWLGLLVDDAPVRDLHEHRDGAVRAAADPSTRTQVERDAVLAETLHSRLAERRMQARNLAALNDLARRLASLHDTGAVLQEVVARSRQLLGVDVAYIMVLQPDRSLRIESADGSLGSALRGMVLREGEGLGGEVVRTGRPLWTESYLEDERLQRVEAMETAALSEQLGGILGVPLQVGGETIGVLLGAERRNRRFLEQEVELLAGLAAHAAVALRNAQLLGNYQQAVDDLQASNASLRELDARRQRAAALRDRLTGVVLAGGGAVEIAAAIGDVVRAPVLVLDADGHPSGSVPDGLDLDHDPPGPDWFTETRTVRRSVGEAGEIAAAEVALRDGYAGCIVVGGAPAVDDETVWLLEIGAVSVALVISSERVVAEAELRTRGELVHALLAPDVDPASIGRRARAAGIDLGALRCVAVLDPGGAARAAASLAARVAAELRGWSAEHAGQIVLLVPTADAEAVRSRLVALAGEELPGPVGVADTAGGVDEVRRAHEAARQTVALLLALGREDVVARPAEMGVYRALFSSSGRGEIAAFVDATLGDLVTQDQSRGRELVTTVEAYLRNAQHHARTCAELHVHANTLYNRLERVEKVLGPSWRDPDRVLELQLALQLRRLATALAPGGP